MKSSYTWTSLLDKNDTNNVLILCKWIFAGLSCPKYKTKTINMVSHGCNIKQHPNQNKAIVISQSTHPCKESSPSKSKHETAFMETEKYLISNLV